MIENNILIGICFLLAILSGIMAENGKRLVVERETLRDKIDSLSSEFSQAVEVAFNAGATEWVRLNFPKEFAKLSAPKDHGTET